MCWCDTVRTSLYVRILLFAEKAFSLTSSVMAEPQQRTTTAACDVRKPGCLRPQAQPQPEPIMKPEEDAQSDADITAGCRAACQLLATFRKNEVWLLACSIVHCLYV